jgi:hypothetical protein
LNLVSKIGGLGSVRLERKVNNYSKRSANAQAKRKEIRTDVLNETTKNWGCFYTYLLIILSIVAIPSRTSFWLGSKAASSRLGE